MSWGKSVTYSGSVPNSMRRQQWHRVLLISPVTPDPKRLKLLSTHYAMGKVGDVFWFCAKQHETSAVALSIADIARDTGSKRLKLFVYALCHGKLSQSLGSGSGCVPNNRKRMQKSFCW